MRIVDAVFNAMERIIPERLSAGGPATSGLLVEQSIQIASGWA